MSLSIGGKRDPLHGTPVRVTGQVQRLSVGAGEEGKEPTIALIQTEGVNIILTIDHRPFIDRATIAAAGVDPMQQQIIVVKQGYLYPDLAEHAPRVIMALSPGATTLQLDAQAYHHLPRPIFPFDTDFDWEPLIT